MKAVILAAKKKESMFPLNDTAPTPLMPLNGKPLILQTIEKLKACNIEEIYVVANYKLEKYQKLFEERNDINIIVQEDLTGTAEALNTCSFIEDDFIVINGDVVVSKNDLSNLTESFGGDFSIMAVENKRPEKYGVLSIENDKVRDIHEKPEKPENPLVNTGVYIFNPEIFDLIQASKKESLTDVVAESLDEIRCRYVLAKEYWLDIGSGKELLKADRVLRSNESSCSISPEAEISDKASVKENATVNSGAVVKAGAVVESSVIGENAVIGPNTVVRNSTVGRGSELDGCVIDHSLLFEDCIVDSFTRVEDVVLAEECDLKSGTVIRESFIGPRSYIDMNNSIRGVKFVPDARTDLSEISK